MSLYDGIKDVAKVMQQADNIDLYMRLLDLSSQALDMQAEIAKLREENAELKKKRDLDEQIVRHKSPYITLLGKPQNICYCAVCWGKSHSLIQMGVSKDIISYHFYCRDCGNAFFAEIEG